MGNIGCPQPKNGDIWDIFVGILGYGTVLGIVAFPIFLLKIDEKNAKEQQTLEKTNKKIENIIQRRETIKNDTVYVIIHSNTHIH